MKKILVFMVIILSAFSKTKEELKNVFSDKKEFTYEQIESQYKIVKELVLKKDINNIIYIREINKSSVNPLIIDVLLENDDVDLYKFFEKKLEIEKWKLKDVVTDYNYIYYRGKNIEEYLLWRAVNRMKSKIYETGDMEEYLSWEASGKYKVNILEYLLLKAKNVNLSWYVDTMTKETLFEKIFLLNDSKLLDLFLSKIEGKERLDLSFLSSSSMLSENNKESMEVLLRYNLDNESKNEILMYLLEINNYDYKNSKELIDKFLNDSLDKSLLLYYYLLNNQYEEANMLIFQGEDLWNLEIKSLIKKMIFENNKKLETSLLKLNRDIDREISDLVKDEISKNDLESIENFIVKYLEFYSGKTNKKYVDILVQEILYSEEINKIKLLEKYKKFDLNSYEQISISNFEVLKYLKEKNYTSEKNYNYDMMVGMEDLEFVKFILEQETKEEVRKKIIERLFFSATKVGNKELINYTLNNGVDVNIKDEEGKNGLFYLITFLINNDIQEGYYEIIDMMVEKGINLNNLYDSKSVLSIIVINSNYSSNKEELIKYFLDKKVDVGYKDKSGYTVYDYANQYKQGNVMDSLYE